MLNHTQNPITHLFPARLTCLFSRSVLRDRARPRAATPAQPRPESMMLVDVRLRQRDGTIHTAEMYLHSSTQLDELRIAVRTQLWEDPALRLAFIEQIAVRTASGRR